MRQLNGLWFKAKGLSYEDEEQTKSQKSIDRQSPRHQLKLGQAVVEVEESIAQTPVTLTHKRPVKNA